MRFAELAIFLAPIGAFVVWRAAILRGLPGPSPLQLYAILGGLLLVAAWLVYTIEAERLPPGRYIPAHLVDGRIVAGHTE